VNSPNRFWVTLSTYLAPPSERQDEGAGIVEYAAILILVAAIAVAVFALGLPQSISDGIGMSVTSILQGNP
jgi:Flp pilus assembly pilin Flp